MTIVDCIIIPDEVRNSSAILPECILSSTHSVCLIGTIPDGLLIFSYATATEKEGIIPVHRNPQVSLPLTIQYWAGHDLLAL